MPCSVDETRFLLKQTAQLARCLGQLNHWTQAGGGNLSVKAKRQLWISRSGAALKKIRLQSDMVRLDLKAPAFLSWSVGDLLNWDLVQAEIDQQTVHSPKPSMEIGMHLLAGVCNLHLHLVRANALSCSLEGWQALKEVAQQEGWCLVPYQMPGPSLARALQQAKGTKQALGPVTILKNHGLLFCASSPKALSKLVFSTEKRLDQFFPKPFSSPRQLGRDPQIDLEQSALHKRSCYRLHHQMLQTDGPLCRLTPDGVVYLQSLWQDQGSGPMPATTGLYLHQGKVYFASSNKEEAKAVQSVLNAQIQIMNQIEEQRWQVDPISEAEVQKLLAWKEYAQESKKAPP